MRRHAWSVVLLVLTSGILLSAERPLYYSYRVHTVSGELVYGGSSDKALNRSVMAINHHSQARRVLFTAPAGEIFSFEMAPTGLLAVSTRDWVKQGEAPPMERSTLHIVDTQGAVIAKVDQGRRYSWRRSGSDIAVVTGDYRGSNEDFATTGVWIVNVPSRTLTKISDDGSHVQWAGFDDSIYIWDTRIIGRPSVRRFDVATRTTETTSHVGIDFSPTGAYYFKPDGIAGRAGIYTRIGNENVILRSSALAAYRHVSPESWAPDADVIMLAVQKDARTFGRVIYDPVNDVAAEVHDSNIVGWGKSSAELLRVHGESVEVRPGPGLRKR